MYFRKDKITTKIIVHLIFILDSIQTFLTMDDLFFWFVYNFDDPSKLDKFRWAFDIPTLDAVIALLVQGVYCWRIWALTGWRVLPITTAFVALLASASGIAIGIQFQRQGTPGPDSKIPTMLWLIGSAAVDVVVASAMTYILLRANNHSRRAPPSMRRKVLRHLTLTLETNGITAVVAVETVIVFFISPIAPPKTNFYQIGAYLLGKLYSNCFMILLNQRHNYGASSETGPTTRSPRRTDAIELGLRDGGGINTFISSMNHGGHRAFEQPSQSETKDLPRGGEYKNSVSFKVPVIDVKKTVITT